MAEASQNGEGYGLGHPSSAAAVLKSKVFAAKQSRFLARFPQARR